MFNIKWGGTDNVLMKQAAVSHIKQIIQMNW
jgi:hypothetical protein